MRWLFVKLCSILLSIKANTYSFNINTRDCAANTSNFGRSFIVTPDQGNLVEASSPLCLRESRHPVTKPSWEEAKWYTCVYISMNEFIPLGRSHLVRIRHECDLAVFTSLRTWNVTESGIPNTKGYGYLIPSGFGNNFDLYTLNEAQLMIQTVVFLRFKKCEKD